MYSFEDYKSEKLFYYNNFNYLIVLGYNYTL